MCQFQPYFVRHVLRADFDDLFACDAGDFFEFGYGRDEFVDGYLSGGIVAAGGAVTGTGNGSACG